MPRSVVFAFLGFFFFNDTATTEIYTLSLHDALPICWPPRRGKTCGRGNARRAPRSHADRIACRNAVVICFGPRSVAGAPVRGGTELGCGSAVGGAKRP